MASNLPTFIVSFIGLNTLAHTALAQNLPPPLASSTGELAPAPQEASGRKPADGAVSSGLGDTTTPRVESETAYVHDGLFLKMSLGAGYASLDGGAELQDTSVAGGGVTLELLLGGTPAPGLVVGGGVVLTNILSPNATSGGENHTINDLTFGALGVFGDYYFDDTGGVHLQAMVGVAAAQVDDPTIGTADSFSGIGIGIGIGYDFWVGEQWSIGPAARLQWATLTNTDRHIDATYMVFAPSALIGATLH